MHPLFQLVQNKESNNRQILVSILLTCPELHPALCDGPNCAYGPAVPVVKSDFVKSALNAEILKQYQINVPFCNMLCGTIHSTLLLT